MALIVSLSGYRNCWRCDRNFPPVQGRLFCCCFVGQPLPAFQCRSTLRLHLSCMRRRFKGDYFAVASWDSRLPAFQCRSTLRLHLSCMRRRTQTVRMEEKVTPCFDKRSHRRKCVGNNDFHVNLNRDCDRNLSRPQGQCLLFSLRDFRNMQHSNVLCDCRPLKPQSRSIDERKSAR